MKADITVKSAGTSKSKRRGGKKKGRGLVQRAKQMMVGASSPTRGVGSLVSGSEKGERVWRGTFVGIVQANGAGNGTSTAVTASSIATALANTPFTKLWNSSNTGVFRRFRVLRFAVEASPIVSGVANRTSTGYYGVGAYPQPTPGSGLDVMMLEESMHWVAPARETTTYTVDSAPICTRKVPVLVYTPSGTDIPWVDSATYGSLNFGSILHFGLGTGTETSYLYLTVEIEFKNMAAE